MHNVNIWNDYLKNLKIKDKRQNTTVSWYTTEYSTIILLHEQSVHTEIVFKPISERTYKTEQKFPRQPIN